MKQLVSGAALAVILALAMGAWAPSASAEPVTVAGRVDYIFDDDFNPVGGTITTPEGIVYRIEWDDQGRAMVDDVYEEDAEVMGEASEKDADKWLKVTSYKRTPLGGEMEPAAPAEPSAAMEPEEMMMEPAEAMEPAASSEEPAVAEPEEALEPAETEAPMESMAPPTPSAEPDEAAEPVEDGGEQEEDWSLPEEE